MYAFKRRYTWFLISPNSKSDKNFLLLMMTTFLTTLVFIVTKFNYTNILNMRCFLQWSWYPILTFLFQLRWQFYWSTNFSQNKQITNHEQINQLPLTTHYFFIHSLKNKFILPFFHKYFTWFFLHHIFLFSFRNINSIFEDTFNSQNFWIPDVVTLGRVFFPNIVSTVTKIYSTYNIMCTSR